MRVPSALVIIALIWAACNHSPNNHNDDPIDAVSWDTLLLEVDGNQRIFTDNALSDSVRLTEAAVSIIVAESLSQRIDTILLSNDAFVMCMVDNNIETRLTGKVSESGDSLLFDFDDTIYTDTYLIDNDGMIVFTVCDEEVIFNSMQIRTFSKYQETYLHDCDCRDELQLDTMLSRLGIDDTIRLKEIKLTYQ